MSIQRSYSWQVLTISKLGNRPDENEDKTELLGNGELAAVSDGATEASFSSDWATSLASSDWNVLLRKSGSRKRFEPTAECIAEWLGTLRHTFREIGSTRELSWFARAKADRGSFATLLGLRITRRRLPGQFHWSAISCGDTCALQARDGQVIHSFPFTAGDSFGNRPSLISSRLTDAMPPITATTRNRCATGDEIILATDALADWLLDKVEGKDRLRTLLGCEDIGEFDVLCRDERKVGNLKNDDSTALICRL